VDRGVIEQPIMTPDRDRAARELLAFYVEAGVDALVGETPVDRFAGEAREESLGGRLSATTDGATGAPPPRPDGYPAMPASRGLQTAPAPSAPSPPSPDAAAMEARTTAARAATLDELRAILDRFDGCALKNTAKQLVFADGNPRARVMFVGEAPGREEDLEGLPFVGRSGQLLDRMMAAIGLDRSGAYIANVIPWRPPGNRTPTPQETAICLPFIRRQIELADPDVLVCLGNPSAQTLLGVKDGIMKTRGRWFAYHTGTREIRAIATFHPAYLLRQPLQKRLAWRDFLAIKQALGGGSGE
jgi:uracil-DNA glycosylase family 4